MLSNNQNPQFGIINHCYPIESTRSTFCNMVNSIVNFVFFNPLLGRFIALFGHWRPIEVTMLHKIRLIDYFGQPNVYNIKLWIWLSILASKQAIFCAFYPSLAYIRLFFGCWRPIEFKFKNMGSYILQGGPILRGKIH